MSAQLPEIDDAVIEEGVLDLTEGSGLTLEEVEELSDPQVEDLYRILWGGSGLHAGELADITVHRITRLITIVGSVGSGKTTLVGSLFSKFQQGSYADLLFCGSKTLVGFEERCFEAMTTSGKKLPETKRTPLGREDNFLHLTLAPVDNHTEHVDVLFYDVTGEQYDNARRSLEDAKKLKYIRQADVVLLLLDGAKLVNVFERQILLKDCRELLRGLCETGQLGKQSRVTIVFSKSDLYKKSDLQFLEHVRERVVGWHGDSFAQLDFCNIAARPDRHAEGDICIGLEEPLKDWVLGGDHREPVKFDPVEIRSRIKLHAEIDRFIA